MKYAILSNGVGNLVGWEAVPDDAELASHQSFFVTSLPENPVLAANETSIEAGSAVTVEMVQAECERRRELPFDYDFGDERGVHTIAMTQKDKEGWDDVTKRAQARINLSDETPITISTETGVCQVTPLEWMAILDFAGDVYEPVWFASFTLQAQDPIPSDYTDDEHWTE